MRYGSRERPIMHEVVGQFMSPSAHEVVLILEIVLAGAAIVLAFLHARHLKGLVGVVSTRYLSVFPLYLTDISQLTEKAKKSIIIFCDFPAYGEFSNSQAFTDYKFSLERKRRAGVSIELTHLSPARMKETARQQFARDFGHRRHMSRFPHLLKEFYDEYGDVTTNRNDYEEFLNLAVSVNIGVLQNVFHNHNCVAVTQHMHIFFWIVDDLEAIFAVASHTEKVLEHGFFTRDPRLIESFKAMRDLYHAELKSHNALSSTIETTTAAPEPGVTH
jgi:hypothetical protein